MNKFISEKNMYKVSFGVAWFSVLVVFIFIAVQSYVRWTINQNFTFMGGFELEAFTLGTFALMVALLFAKHRD